MQEGFGGDCEEEIMNEHWTLDPDLLEQYVLGKTPASELSELEAHLKRCSQCQQAVNKERIIVAGIKQFGRQKMKEKVQSRFEDRRSLGWQTIMSAAAVIVIAVGVAFYVFEMKEEAIIQEEVSSPKSQADLTEGDPREQSVESGRGDQRRMAEVERAPVPATQPSPRSKMEMKDESTLPTSAAGAPPKKEQADRVADEAEDASDSFWVEGVLSEESKSDAAEPRERVEVFQKSVRQERKRPQQFAQSEWKQTVVQGKDTLVVTTIFKPTTSLSPAQQAKAKISVSAVPTLIQKQRNEMKVTVFKDLESSPGDAPQIRLPRGDSLIIQLDGQQIRYKLKHP